MPILRRLLLVKYRHRFLLYLVLMPLSIVMLSLMMGVGVVEATDGMRGNSCVVAEDEYIEHDFYFSCWTLTVRGTIEGDLIGVASKVRITQDAVITGDVWVVGGQLSMRGDIGDDVRFGGADLDIQESSVFTNVGTDITALALSVEIEDGVVIPGDLSMIGYQALIYGDIGGSIDFQGQSLVIDGFVDGDIDAVVGDSRQEISLRTIPFLPYSIRLNDYGLYIDSDARVGGELHYEAPQPASISSAVLTTPAVYTQSLSQQDITRARQPQTFFSILRNYIIEVLRDFIPLTIVGGLFLQFAPAVMTETGKRIRGSALPAVSWGLILTVLFFPITLLAIIISLLLVFLIAVITLNSMTTIVALLLTIINLVFVFGFGFLLFYLGRAIACYLVGIVLTRIVRYYIAMRSHDPDDPPVYIPQISANYRWVLLAIGTILYSLIVNVPLPSPIPTFTLLLEALAAFSGLGALFMLGRDLWYRYELRQGVLLRRRHSPFDNMLDDRDIPPGMDNLPDGFTGFDS